MNWKKGIRRITWLVSIVLAFLVGAVMHEDYQAGSFWVGAAIGFLIPWSAYCIFAWIADGFVSKSN
jgi:hypothetical protein